MNTESLKPTEPPRDRISAAEAFRTTRWTQVNRSKSDSPDGRRALAELCEAYFEPVAAFLRYEVRDANAAGDLAQDFFARILAGGTIAHADRERGRFRSYLLGAVKHFLSHHREAMRRQKRGGGVENLSLHDMETGELLPLADGRELTPDAAFDRQWALTVLGHTMATLQRECAAAGRAEFFEAVKPWLTGEAAHGDQSALAKRCGMNANALKVAIHRMKRRFRELLKAEIAGTLDDPGVVEEEMEALFAALGR